MTPRARTSVGASVEVVPANEVACSDLQTVFGTRVITAWPACA